MKVIKIILEKTCTNRKPIVFNKVYHTLFRKKERATKEEPRLPCRMKTDLPY